MEPMPPAPPPPPGPEQTLTFGDLLFRLTPRAWVTPTLVAACVGIYLLMVATGVAPMSPSSEDLLKWGADFGPWTLGRNEWWRLFTACFLHIGALHLAFNMYALWNMGRLVERLYGNLAFLLLYVFAGLGGSVASLLWNPQVLSAGASGAIFGVVGALGAFVVLKRSQLPPGIFVPLRNSTLSFVGYNLFLGFTLSFVDNAAHIGGLITGFLAGAAFLRDLHPSAPARVTRFLPAIGIALVLAVAALAAQKRSEPKTAVQFYQLGLRQLLEQHPAQAEASFTRALELGGDDGDTRVARASARQLQQNLAGQAEDVKRASELGPTTPVMRVALGQMLTQLGDAESALKWLNVPKKDPLYAEVMASRAEMLQQLMRHDEALAVYAEALAEVPRDSKLLNNNAWALVRLERYADALPLVERALEATPDSAAALGTRCWTLVGLDRLKDAEPDCRKATELSPGGHYDLGMLAFIRGQKDEAAKHWEAEAAANPRAADELAPWIAKARAP